jgi:hypothetical protein
LLLGSVWYGLRLSSHREQNAPDTGSNAAMVVGRPDTSVILRYSTANPAHNLAIPFSEEY